MTDDTELWAPPATVITAARTTKSAPANSLQNAADIAGLGPRNGSELECSVSNGVPSKRLCPFDSVVGTGAPPRVSHTFHVAKEVDP